MTLVAGGFDLITWQDVAGRAAYACSVVVEVQGDAVLLLELVGIDRLRQVVGAVVVGVEVERLVHREAQSLAGAVAHVEPAVVAAQTTVLRYQVGLEHIIHSFLINANSVTSLAVGIVLLWAATVPLHLLHLVAERHGQSDTWQ